MSRLRLCRKHLHSNEKSGSDDEKSFDASEDSFDPDDVPDDDDDAASAVSFDPEKAGSKVASEKSFDPDREEDEQDLSGFEEESKTNVATISADVAQRVSACLATYRLKNLCRKISDDVVYVGALRVCLKISTLMWVHMSVSRQ